MVIDEQKVKVAKGIKLKLYFDYETLQNLLWFKKKVTYLAVKHINVNFMNFP